MFLWLATASVYIPNETGELTAVDPQSSLETLTQIPPGDYGTAFIKMFLTLIAFIVLLFGSFWFLRRLIQQRLQKGVGEQSIQILEKRMISPKTMLYLIEVENKKVLIAESHLEVKKIETIPRVIQESDYDKEAP
ncbi:MAG TPA: flagellar biosynthetic protein FliO [Chlamydiales bacterium]|nr:flagellar biosynthetic protein FliO [Chlamydiales bacterium]